MTHCSYRDLLQLLHSKGVKIIGNEPNCPKKMDSFCMEKSGHCEQGNKKDCEQHCTIMMENGGLYRFQVMFVIRPNSQDGYVVKETLSIQNLIERNVISESDLHEQTS